MEKGVAVSLKKSGVGWRVGVWRRGVAVSVKKSGVEGLGLEKPVVMELCEAVEGNRWEGCQLTVP